MTSIPVPAQLDYSRQGPAIPNNLWHRNSIIVGCGTTGSWTAHNLLRMGFLPRNITIIDPDIVGPENLPAQFLRMSETQSQQTKTSAFIDAMDSLRLPCPRGSYVRRFEDIPDFGAMLVDNVVFCCVDSVDSRRYLADLSRRMGAYRFVDYRMGGESGGVLFTGEKVEMDPDAAPRLLRLPGPMPWTEYMKTLDVEFKAESECGVKALLSNAHAIVGIALTHLFRAERGLIRLKGRIVIDTASARIEEDMSWMANVPGQYPVVSATSADPLNE